MSELQRWVWTPTGMEPYRPHPLMPDVGGVFVRAEECVELEKQLAIRDIATPIRNYYTEKAVDADWAETVGRMKDDRDRWRTWAGEARSTLADLNNLGGLGLEVHKYIRATLAAYPTEGDSGTEGKG